MIWLIYLLLFHTTSKLLDSIKEMHSYEMLSKGCKERKIKGGWVGGWVGKDPRE